MNATTASDEGTDLQYDDGPASEERDGLVDEEDAAGDPRRSASERVYGVLKNVTVEPAMFLLTFGYGLHSIIAQVGDFGKVNCSKYTFNPFRIYSSRRPV